MNSSDLINFTKNSLKDIENTLESVENENEIKKEYERETLETLKKTEVNTANLTEIAFLIREGNVVNEALYESFIEMLSIIKANDEEEAKSIYRNVMDNINTVRNDAESIEKIGSIGLLLIKMFFTTFA